MLAARSVEYSTLMSTSPSIFSEPTEPARLAWQHAPCHGFMDRSNPVAFAFSRGSRPTQTGSQARSRNECSPSTKPVNQKQNTKPRFLYAPDLPFPYRAESRLASHMHTTLVQRSGWLWDSSGTGSFEVGSSEFECFGTDWGWGVGVGV